MSPSTTISTPQQSKRMSTWIPELSTETWQQWWQETQNGLSALEFCDKPGEFSAFPVLLDEALFEGIRLDLPKLLNLARRISRQDGNVQKWARADQLEVVLAYGDVPEVPAIARPDGIFVGDQLKLLELNLGSGVGGFFEVDYVQSRFRRLAEIAGLSDTHTPDASSALVDLIRQVREASPLAPFKIAMMPLRHFRPYHVRQAHQLAQRVNDEVRDCECRIAYADQLHNQDGWLSDGVNQFHMVWMNGAPMHPEELMAPVMKALMAGRASNTLVLSNPCDMAVEGKLVLAALSEGLESHSRHFNDDDRSLIERYVPWSRTVTPRNVAYQGKNFDLQELMYEHRAGLVLKRGHSKSTQQVFIGAEQSDAQWRECLAVAFAEDSQWMVQENLRSNAQTFAYCDAQGKPESQAQCFTYNQFVFGQGSSAPLIRIERDPNRRKVAMAVSSAMAITGTILCSAESIAKQVAARSADE